MARIHKTSLGHLEAGIVNAEESSQNEKTKQRLAGMKASDNTVMYEKAFEHISDDEIFKEIQAKANAFVNSGGGYKEEQELAKTLESYNLLLYCYPYHETSQAKRDVARMAFTGHVDRPGEHKISGFLRDLKNRPHTRDTSITANDYNMENSSMWNVFKQVPEFAAAEDKLKAGLARYNVPPERIADLDIKDICFILNEQFRGDNKDSAKVLEEGYKAKHTKRFIRENEKEFKDGMRKMLKVSDKDMEAVRKIAELTDKIKKDNKNLTPDQLSGKIGEEKNKILREYGINKEGFKNVLKNMEYINELVGAMKHGVTDLSKDRDGNPTKWDGMPVIDVHHVVNIKDASAKERQGKSFADVNAYENMCFIVRQPQHDAMHALETDANGFGREDLFVDAAANKKFIFRIQPPEGVKCMFGFDHMIYDQEYVKNHDMEKSNIANNASLDPNYYANRDELADKQEIKAQGLKIVKKSDRQTA